MIIQQCDLCNKKTTAIKSIVLHKKTIDYCTDCEKKANKIVEDFKQIIKQEYILFECRLKRAEQKFYFDKIKKYE